jgi:hypothetical protein
MAGAGQHLPRAKARYLLRKRIAIRLQEASSEAQHRGEGGLPPSTRHEAQRKPAFWQMAM